MKILTKHDLKFVLVHLNKILQIHFLIHLQGFLCNLGLIEKFLCAVRLGGVQAHGLPVEIDWRRMGGNEGSVKGPAGKGGQEKG